MKDILQFLPKKLIELASLCPYPLYVVGGTCREALTFGRGRRSDFDICSPMLAEEFSKAAEKCGFEIKSVYKNTGTVKLCGFGDNYEYTSFRTDEYVRGNHNPAKIYFTDDIEKDARRRDFKCNAVYFDIAAKKYVDPLGGMSDIQKGIITTVAPANKVFGEDGLRLMRLARQAAECGFTPTDECMEGARRNCKLINDISPERIWTELNAILHADEKYGREYAQYNGLKIAKDTGVLGEILPELMLGDGMAQRSDFHNHDVLEHSLRCVKYADKSIRLAALLHDVGKPACLKENGNFHGHEGVGEDICGDICRRLRIPKKLELRAGRLIAMHMYDFNCEVSEKKVRKFIVRNYEYIDDLLKLKQADFSACKDNLTEAPTVTKWKKLIKKMQQEGVPFTLKELTIRGDKLIDAGISPDQVGKTLEFLLEQTAIKSIPNTPRHLIKLALEYNRH